MVYPPIIFDSPIFLVSSFLFLFFYFFSFFFFFIPFFIICFFFNLFYIYLQKRFLLSFLSLCPSFKTRVRPGLRVRPILSISSSLIRVSVPWFFCSQDFGSFWLSENGCSRAARESHISYSINAWLPNQKGKLFLLSFCYLFAYRPLQCRSSCFERKGLHVYFIPISY